MSGGGGGGDAEQTTTVEPWEGQKPYLSFGFGEGKRLYDENLPGYFPGGTVAPMQPEQDIALDLTAQRALTGSPLVGAAQGYAGAGLGGEYLGSNPYLDATYGRAADRMTDIYRNAVMPGINSQFAGSRAVGSGAHMRQQALAQEALGEGLADLAANMYGENYARERGLQQQLAAMAPGLAGQDYVDMGALAGVGEARQAQQQRELSADIDRHNYEQMAPWEQLARYMGTIQGNYGQTATSRIDEDTDWLGTGLGLGLIGLGAQQSGLFSGLPGILGFGGQGGVIGPTLDQFGGIWD